MTVSLQTRRTIGKAWAIPGVLLSVASVGIAGTDLAQQLFLAPPGGIALGHTLISLAVFLVGLVLCIVWFAHLLTRSASQVMPLTHPSAPDISEEQTFVIAANNAPANSQAFVTISSNPGNSGQGFMITTGNPNDSGKTFASVSNKLSDSGRYGQPAPLYSTEEVSIRRAALGVPISSDPLFGYPQPTVGERCFVLPREGEPLVECQDRYALNATRRRYAVADGVSGSFLPGPWASIIAQGFVDSPEVFSEKETCQRWLFDCCASWNAWMQQRWVPAMNWQRQLQGEQPGDWSEEIVKGAQTTLTGITIASPNAAGLIDISVWAIGDAQFFVFRQEQAGLWTMQTAFPLTNAAQFGYKPDTLFTIAHPFLFEQAWNAHKTLHYTAQPGDYAVLATDTLAKWMMQQALYGPERLPALLQCTHQEQFRTIIHEELRAKRIEEDDDMTMLVISV